MSTTTQGPTRVSHRATGVSPRVLSAYRKLRTDGYSRREANLIVIGAIIASHEGGGGVVKIDYGARRSVRP